MKWLWNFHISFVDFYYKQFLIYLIKGHSSEKRNTDTENENYAFTSENTKWTKVMLYLWYYFFICS